MKNCIFLTLLLSICNNAVSQETAISLEFCIENALLNSHQLKLVKNNIALDRLEIKSYNQSLRPSLSLSGGLPILNRSITSITQDDGQEQFINRSTMNNRLGLNLDYQLQRTGGTLYFGSNIDRLDVFRTNRYNYSRNYFFTPISIGINQPIFAFNEVKWRFKEINIQTVLLDFNEAIAREEVVSQVVEIYSRIYQYQSQKEEQSKQKKDLESLLLIKKSLFETGQGSKMEILRLEQQLQSEIVNITKVNSQLGYEKYRMSTLVKLPLDTDVYFLKAEPILIDIDRKDILAKASENLFEKNIQALENMQIEKNVERARKNRNMSVNLNVSFGANNNSERFLDLANGFQDRQLFSFTFNVPLSGWNKYRTGIEIANLQNEEMKIDRLQRNDFLLIESERLFTAYDMAKRNFLLNEEILATASNVLKIAHEEYKIGSLDINSLNQIRQERERALSNYYSDILEINQLYYQIRRLCLFDFVSGKSLIRS